MMYHDFQDSLKRSKSHASAPWWEPVYRAAFPTFAGMRYVNTDGWAQRAGIDRFVDLKDGTSLKIDEKVREKVWPDFALERWSDRDKRSPGWVQKDLATDFIAYAFIPTQTCYLLPFRTLRRAWALFGRDWIALAEKQVDGFRFIHAENRSYTTESVAVPIAVLLGALTDAMIVRWQQA